MTKARLTIDLDEFKPGPRRSIRKQRQPSKRSPKITASRPAMHPNRLRARRQRLPNLRQQTRRPRQKARASLAGAAASTTNRNTPFAVKLKVETNNMIYDYADRLECSAIAEVIELALGALQKELDEGIDPRARAAAQVAAKR
ncbi:hypothetical protein PZN02_006377 (plasmid) [Sinorhizobium garamanticum]|uniref:Stability/partitioning determinant n=1 Tax=Sinorhizobium garamanticum TaxID=680247 RepID=A0ABY8DKW9_9HYPH|nr:hypothetical protein [Sinorhizobium garamanticum]WEX91551.1 hypothetical protein PZN02_006377 [Sinorhizobium garamanticum]